MNFAKNIALLRKRKKRSQDDLSSSLGIPRSTWSGYERGISEPSFTTLIKISEYFKVSIDNILVPDLTKLPESKISAIEREREYDLEGKHIRVLTTTVDSDDNENIELVPQKASAGYTTGHSDPKFVQELAKFQLPFLGRNRTHRTFQIKGDSMPPLKTGYWVTGSYLQDLSEIKDGKPYIIVTKNDGIVFKLVYNKIENSKSLLLVSTNPIYEPYLVPVEEILEVWQFVNSINTEFDI